LNLNLIKKNDEDKELKENIDMLCERIMDGNEGLAKTALE